LQQSKIEAPKEPNKSAKPAFNILNTSLKINKNNPFTSKKTPITKYAIGLAKNELNSFFKMAINEYFLFV
jgi:hypothetical protein